MSLGAAGSVALFLFISIGALLFGIYLLIYAAHCFLTVFVGTAASGDDVGWPDDIVIDWVWKAVYLTWMFGVWVVPCFFFALFAGSNFFPDMSPDLLVALVAGLAWLFFPISLLSAQSSESPWFVMLRWEVLRRLSFHLPAYIVVSVFTAALTAGWVALAGYSIYGMYTGRPWMLLLAAPAGAAVLLINARLLGRLGWLIAFRSPDPPERDKKRKKTLRRPATVALEASDPWQAEEAEAPPDAVRDFARPAPEPEPQPEPTVEELEDEWGPPKPYRLAERPPTPGPPLPRPGPRPIDAADPDDVYGMLPEEKSAEPIPIPMDGYTPVGTEPPPKPPPGEGPLNNSGMDSIEERLAKGRENLEPPRFALFSGVYTFPWYPESLRPWLYLTFFGLVLGFLLHWQLLMWPFGNE
jgi:hypothetical protein